MIQIDEKDARTVAVRAEERRLRAIEIERNGKWNELEAHRARLQARMELPATEMLRREADKYLLGGESPPSGDTSSVERLEHEIRVLDVAIQKQNQIVHAARGRFSRALHEWNYITYRAVEDNIAKAVEELVRANQAEINFFDELRDAGCTSMRFRTMRVNTVDREFMAAFRREFSRFVDAA